jgi:hypothetical protein
MRFSSIPRTARLVIEAVAIGGGGSAACVFGIPAFNHWRESTGTRAGDDTAKSDHAIQNATGLHEPLAGTIAGDEMGSGQGSTQDAISSFRQLRTATHLTDAQVARLGDAVFAGRESVGELITSYDTALHRTGAPSAAVDQVVGQTGIGAASPAVVQGLQSRFGVTAQQANEIAYGATTEGDSDRTILRRATTQVQILQHGTKATIDDIATMLNGLGPSDTSTDGPPPGSQLAATFNDLTSRGIPGSDAAAVTATGVDVDVATSIESALRADPRVSPAVRPTLAHAAARLCKDNEWFNVTNADSVARNVADAYVRIKAGTQLSPSDAAQVAANAIASRQDWVSSGGPG